jgi:hypothetical protein
MDGNPEEIQKNIEARISALPEDIQNAIFSSDFNEKIGTIGTSNQLHIDQIQNMSDDTMLFMIGFMDENEYRSELTNVLKGNSALVQKIMTEVNQQVLLPVRESMKKFQAGKKAPELTPAPIAPASKPALSDVLPKGPATTPTPVVEMKPSPMPMVAPTPAMPPMKAVDMHPADIALTQKTVATPPVSPTPATPVTTPKPVQTKVEPPKPQNYKADPYREPTN